MSAVFSKALDVANDNLLSAQLAHIEKTEGRKLPCYQMAMVAKAKPPADVLGEETFDAATAAPRREAFEAITDETLDFVKPQKDALPIEGQALKAARKTSAGRSTGAVAACVTTSPIALVNARLGNLSARAMHNYYYFDSI